MKGKGPWVAGLLLAPVPQEPAGRRHGGSFPHLFKGGKVLILRAPRSSAGMSALRVLWPLVCQAAGRCLTARAESVGGA